MAVPTQSSDEPQGFAYAPGDIIAGKYALEEMLGEGGMGAVFRARNTAIDMAVALKLIRADLNREVLSGRLLQEARAAAKLSHPAIVRVFDVGQTEHGDPFIVMELLTGENLADVMTREGRLTSPRAVQLLLPIADALSAAHSKGFVHRDVKPDNVFIVVDGDQLQPKLVDFGIVKLEQHEKDSKLTAIGTVLGSPDYMSPEQARGLENIDLRSDVWSFAVVLYEAIAGQTPFSAPNYNALLRMIVEGQPPSLLELKAADAELSAIVARALSKDPAERYASMYQFGRTLAEWLTNQGLSEDACGVSLEAKWLSRMSDPQTRFVGRSPRPGGPDSWPEAPTGVRTVQGLGTARTVEVGGKPAGTPVSIAPLVGSVPPRAPKVYRGVVAGAVALAGLLLWVALSESSPTESHSAASRSGPVIAETKSLAKPAAATTPPPSAPTLDPGVTPAAPLTPGPSSKVAAAKAVTSAPKRHKAPNNAAMKAPKPLPPATTAQKPTAAPPSDLLSPY